MLGGNTSGRKTWPELVGIAGEEAERRIKEQIPGVTVHKIPQGNFVTMDFRTNRVRIFVDSAGNVARPPQVG